MKKRKLTEAERAAISARYGATCDVRTVTVCKPGAVTPWDDIQDRWTKQAKRGRDRANGKRKGVKNE